MTDQPKARPPIVINEKQLDQQMRLHAVQLAVKFHEGTGLSEMELIPFATEIFNFINGENTNV